MSRWVGPAAKAVSGLLLLTRSELQDASLQAAGSGGGPIEVHPDRTHRELGWETGGHWAAVCQPQAAPGPGCPLAYLGLGWRPRAFQSSELETSVPWTWMSGAVLTARQAWAGCCACFLHCQASRRAEHIAVDPGVGLAWPGKEPDFWLGVGSHLWAGTTSPAPMAMMAGFVGMWSTVEISSPETGQTSPTGFYFVLEPHLKVT